jgi:glutaredoxin
MDLILYQQPSCPFCKHFQRLFYKTIPEGKEVVIPSHSSEIWKEKGINFVPTVIAYKDGKEVDRLSAVKLIGIRKNRWLDWLKKLENDHDIDLLKSK